MRRKQTEPILLPSNTGSFRRSCDFFCHEGFRGFLSLEPTRVRAFPCYIPWRDRQSHGTYAQREGERFHSRCYDLDMHCWTTLVPIWTSFSRFPIIFLCLFRPSGLDCLNITLPRASRSKCRRLLIYRIFFRISRYSATTLLNGEGINAI